MKSQDNSERSRFFSSILIILSGLLVTLFSSSSFAQPCFTLSETEVCAGSAVVATNCTPGNKPSNYRWVLTGGNDNIIVDDANIWEVFSANIVDGEEYTLCLYLDFGTPSQSSFCDTIRGLKLPVPAFSFEPSLIIYLDDTIHFTDESIPGDAPIVEWSWELEDAAIPVLSSSQNPSFSFSPESPPGCKDVVLFLTDNNGCKSSLEQSLFNDAICILGRDCSRLDGLDFKGEFLSSSCPPLISTFEVSEPYKSMDYEDITWSFGNGKPETNENSISTVYTNIGESGENGPFYDVSLKVKTSDGCQKEVIKNNYVFVGGPGGAFNVAPNPVKLGDTVTYSHTTRGATDYFWNFHDGQALLGPAENNIKRVANLIGTFQSSLIIKDDAACTVVIEGDLLEILLETGIQEDQLERFAIFPNPVSNKIFPDKDYFNKIESVKLYDVTGMEVKGVDITSNQIDVSFLENGQYFLLLEGIEKNYVAKFVKVGE